MRGIAPILYNSTLYVRGTYACRMGLGNPGNPCKIGVRLSIPIFCVGEEIQEVCQTAGNHPPHR